MALIEILITLISIISCHQAAVDQKELVKDLSILGLLQFPSCLRPPYVKNMSEPYLKELHIDVINLWNASRELQHNDLGCVMLCIVKSLYLVEEFPTDIKLNQRNFNIFLETFGGDALTITTFSKLFGYCKYQIHKQQGFRCWIYLQFMKCFGQSLAKIGWLPGDHIEDDKMLLTLQRMPPSVEPRSFTRNSKNSEL